MFKIMLALHLLLAIAVIGPLFLAGKGAWDGIRRGDATEIALASKVLKLYSILSVLVVIFGFGLMSAKPPWGGEHTAEFSDPYIWISLVLWLVAVGVIHGTLLPQLNKASERIAAGESVSDRAIPIAVIGGVFSVIFAVIVFLMVYKPGS